MKTQKPTGDYFRYIDIDAVDNIRHIVTAPKLIKVTDAPSRASRALQQGSVIFSMVRPYLENIAFIMDDISPCIASTGFYVCNSNGSLYPEFMFYLMLSRYVVDGLNQYMKGDNSPSISFDSIENWLYPIPPYKEQITVVNRIKSLYDIIHTIENGVI